MAVVVFWGVGNRVEAIPTQKLPFPAGETWWVSQGNNQGNHNVANGYPYSWDFNWGVGSQDLGRPVIATASGKVVIAGYYEGWGNTVVVKHTEDFYSRVAHLQYISVVVDQEVIQGYMLGACGSTGTSSGAHIHYQVYDGMPGYGGINIPSSFVEAGIPLGCNCSEDDGNHRYTSQNDPHGPGFYADGWYLSFSPAFLDAYQENGGYAKLGMPHDNCGTPYDNCGTDLVHEWYGIWIQDFESNPHYYGTDGQTALIYSPEKAKTYLVKEGFWCVYKGVHPDECYIGSQSACPIAPPAQQVFGPVDLGTPLSNEQSCFDACGRPAKCQIFERAKLVYASPIRAYFGDYRGEIDDDGGGDDDIVDDEIDDDIGPIIPPCQFWADMTPVEQDDYYFGLIFNGQVADDCGWGWKGYATSSDRHYRMFTLCDHGEETRGLDNCVLGPYNDNLGNQPFPIHEAQLTNSDSFPLEIEAGEVYHLSFLAQGSVPEQLEVALTARDAYDAYNDYSRNLTSSIAPTYKTLVAPEWQSYSFHFLPTVSDPNAAIRFFGGAEVGSVYLDDIKLELVEPEENPNPSLAISRSATGQITANLIWAEEDGYLVGLTGSAVTRYDIVTAELEQIGQLVDTAFWTDQQSFDPYGNALYLPGTNDQQQVWFYLVDRQNERHYLDLDCWDYSGGERFQIYGNDALDYGELLPDYEPPELNRNPGGSNQITVTYQTDDQGKLVGFSGGSLYPEEVCSFCRFAKACIVKKNIVLLPKTIRVCYKKNWII